MNTLSLLAGWTFGFSFGIRRPKVRRRVWPANVFCVLEKGASMLGPVTRGLAILATTLFGTVAVAEVTLSSSNNPTIELDARMSALFGAERDVLNRVKRSGFSRLVEPPKNNSPEPNQYTRSKIDAMPVATGDSEWACLTEALYFEARGETLLGIFGVAEVILNRVDDRRYPSTVCGVINQGTGERYRCQFTYTCDGRPEVFREKKAHQLVGKIAKIMLNEAPRTLTDGATHYHTKAVRPRWSRVFPRTTTIGFHHFYREPSRLVSG